MCYILIMNENKKRNAGAPSRASVPKSALARLYLIDQRIASGVYPNAKQLVEYLREPWGKVSIATVGRDIAFMRDRLNAPIDYDAKNRGIYYTEPNYRIPMGFSGADELLALGMAKNILNLYRDTPIYDAAHKLLVSITAPLASEGSSDWYENRIVIPQTPTAPVPQEIWNQITKALRENRVLVFDYRRSYDEDYKSRRVRPYQLLFDTGVWYIYGFSEERKGIRIFSIGRIKNMTLTKDRFTLPDNFDYRTNNSGSYFGAYAGQKKHKFKIAFYDYSVPWVMDRNWADDQKIKETDDGIIISFSSTQFGKVAEWVLSRGSTAQPLEPETLVSHWRNEVNEMYKKAGIK